MGLLIHNATIVTNNATSDVLFGQAVAIDGSRIAAIGQEADLKAKYAGFEQIDGGGRVLMPGFTNAHMHFYGMYARGLSLNQTPHNFHEILLYLWWALDKVLDDEAVYYSALIPAI
ncbi:MAG: chlorohydrolase, partial [Anaerolineae bacterium]|nr:chlorohydrolase [Anaerolineae bacterium]